MPDFTLRTVITSCVNYYYVEMSLTLKSRVVHCDSSWVIR